MAVLDLNVVRATISAVSATAQQQDKQPTNNIVKAHSGGDKQHTHTHISPNGCNLTGLDFFPSSTLSLTFSSVAHFLLLLPIDEHLSQTEQKEDYATVLYHIFSSIPYSASLTVPSSLREFMIPLFE